MRQLGFCVLALSLLAWPGRASGQEEPADSARAEIDEILAALIEKTNRLQSFSARYEHRGEEGTMSFELDFSADPDRVRLVAEAPGLSMKLWSRDAVLTMVGAPSAESTTFARASLREVMKSTAAPPERLLDQLCPREDEEDRPEGASVLILVEPKADGEHSINCQVTWESSRKALLGWLPRLADGMTPATLEQELIRFEPDRDVTIWISRETGFVTRIEKREPDDHPKVLELVRLERDAEIDEKLLDPPEREESWRDVSTAFGAKLTADIRRDVWRSAYTRIIDCERDGKLPWNPLTRKAVIEVLEVIHKERLAEVSTRALAHYRKLIEQNARSLSAFMEKDRAAGLPEEHLRARAAEVVERARTDLLAGLDRQPWIPKLSDGIEDLQGSRTFDQIRSLEKVVVMKIVVRDVADPLLELFEEKVESLAGAM